MYQVSDAYKAAVKKQSRDWKARIGVSYKDGTSADFTDDAITGGITIYSQAVSGDAGANTIDIGAAPEAWIEFTLIDSDSNLHRYAGAILSLTVSLKLESGEYEDVPMGVFWVDTGQISRQGTHINIVAYDSMMSYNYTLTDSFRASLKGMTAAEAAFQLTLYSKARYRHDMDISGYPNSDIPLDFSNTQIVTGWDAIMWIAQLMGCFAHIGRLNTLEFVQIKSTWEYFDESHTTGTIIVDKNIGGSERYRTTFADDRIHIIGVSMPNSKNNIITRSGAYLDSDANVIIALERNPLIKDDAIEDVLANMLVPLSTAYFYAFSSEVMSDPALDVGDMVRLQGGVINGTNKNNDLIGFITHNTWRYRGRQEIVNTGQATDVESDTAPTSGDAPFYSTPKTQTEKRVDALEGKVGATDRLIAPDGSMWVLDDEMLHHYAADGTSDCGVYISHKYGNDAFDVKINFYAPYWKDWKKVEFYSNGDEYINAVIGSEDRGITLATQLAPARTNFRPLIKFSLGNNRYKQLELWERYIYFENNESGNYSRYRINMTSV